MEVFGEANCERAVWNEADAGNHRLRPESQERTDETKKLVSRALLPKGSVAGSQDNDAWADSPLPDVMDVQGAIVQLERGEHWGVLPPNPMSCYVENVARQRCFDD